ncbi:MAG: hypothetical protein Alpg2KO_01780 [Alphaproteobacteria bacterium]
MSNRVIDFFSKGVSEAWTNTKKYYKENPTRGKLAIAGGLVGMIVDPQAPIGVPAALVSIEADKRRHEKLMGEIREAAAEGKSLEGYKLKLENFGPDRIKDSYSRGGKQEQETRLKRTATWLGGGVVEVLATGGLGAAISAGFSAHRARKRDKLVRELEGRSGPSM